jgi:hypothetical protein
VDHRAMNARLSAVRTRFFAPAMGASLCSVAMAGVLVTLATAASSPLALEATLTGDRTASTEISVYASPAAAISADGTTAIVGEASQGGGAGAAWVFTRAGTSWTQQAKIAAPADATGRSPHFGMTVAVTPDGNTALIGGAVSGRGAAWVYTRSGASWTETKKISPPDDTSEFAFRVAISADGSTAAITAINNDGMNAAVYVYTHSGSDWVFQSKIPYPTDSRAQVLFGTSVALSSDGNTAIVGSGLDEGSRGAYRVYTRAGSSWTQQQKLAPATDDHFGGPVALSGSGDTALLGSGGRTLVYARSGSSWSRVQELVLDGKASVGSNLANTLALSGDGTTAFVGGATETAGYVAKFTKTASGWVAQGATDTPAAAGELGAIALSADNERLIANGGTAALVYRMAAPTPPTTAKPPAKPTVKKKVPKCKRHQKSTKKKPCHR